MRIWLCNKCHTYMDTRYCTKCDNHNERSAIRVLNICFELRDTWENHDQLRLGQLICNILHDNNIDINSLYNVEDDKMVEMIRKYKYKQSDYQGV